MRISQLCTFAVLRILAVNVTGGLMFGYVIGYVAIYTIFDNDSRSCHRFTTPVACLSVSHSAKCQWESGSNSTYHCIYKDTFDESPPYECFQFDSHPDHCKTKSFCHWDFGNKKCEHNVGMTTSQMGIFTGVMTLGCMISAFCAGSLVQKFGFKACITGSGFVALFGSLYMHLGRGWDSYFWNVLGRFLSGFAMGAICVFSTFYVETKAPEQFKEPIGVAFQASITTGIMMIAFMGLVLYPRDTGVKQSYEARIQAMIAIQTLTSLVYVFIGLTTKDNCKHLGTIMNQEELQYLPAVGNETVEKMSHTDCYAYNYRELLPCFAIATMMCVAQQLTGINAIMNYAPTMVSHLSIEPVVGNFIIMFWNCITSIIAIPLVYKMKLRDMFVVGLLLATLSHFVTIIPLTNGFAVSKTSQGPSLWGILLFIAFLEIGVSPTFFVLVLKLFPDSYQHVGTAYSNGFAAFLNIIINVFYPICVTYFSGGPSGNQNRGVLVCFVSFIVCGFVSFFITFKWLHPFYETPLGKLSLEMARARREEYSMNKLEKNNKGLNHNSAYTTSVFVSKSEDILIDSYIRERGADAELNDPQLADHISMLTHSFCRRKESMN